MNEAVLAPDPARVFAELFKGLAARRAPGVLYHYTSQTALLSIAQRHALWATNIRYLNDASEFQLALALTDEFLAERLENSLPRYERALYGVLQDGLSQMQQTDVYVASFSEHGNQLSQWRAYCPPGSGYSLGFTPAALRSISGANDSLRLLRCLYVRNEQVALVGRLIAQVLAFAEANHVSTTSLKDTVYRRCFTLFTKWLPLIAAVVKDASFVEEAEWRLVAPGQFFAPALPSIRAGHSMLVPYFELRLPSTGKSLQLEELTIGPTPHPLLAEQAVNALMEATRTRVKRLQQSNIPFRTW